MREFITAVQQETSPEDSQGIEFTLGKTILVDGEEVVEKRTCTAYPPVDGQVAMMMARIGRHSSAADKVAGFVDFFVGVLDDGDYQYVVDRLLDRKDPLGVEEITEIMKDLMEEWGGRPTK